MNKRARAVERARERARSLFLIALVLIFAPLFVSDNNIVALPGVLFSLGAFVYVKRHALSFEGEVWQRPGYVNAVLWFGAIGLAVTAFAAFMAWRTGGFD